MGIHNYFTYKGVKNFIGKFLLSIKFKINYLQHNICCVSNSENNKVRSPVRDLSPKLRGLLICDHKDICWTRTEWAGVIIAREAQDHFVIGMIAVLISL